MDDLGEKLSAVLNDPEQMKAIADMAKSFMSGGALGESEPEPEAQSTSSLFDPGMIQKLASFMKGSSKRNDKQVLLEAMKPYLSEKRRNKVDKAMRLAKLATFAEVALASFKEEDDV
jgi:hypothetical protein